MRTRTIILLAAILGFAGAVLSAWVPSVIWGDISRSKQLEFRITFVRRTSGVQHWTVCPQRWGVQWGQASRWLDMPNTGDMPLAEPPGWLYCDQSGVDCTTFGYGWPLVGLRHVVVRTPSGGRTLDLEPLWNVPLTGGKVFVPVYPVWSGLAINTLTFVLPVGGLLAYVSTLRRARRVRRGQCVQCGYDLRGQTAPGCPECGWGRDVVPTTRLD